MTVHRDRDEGPARAEVTLSVRDAAGGIVQVQGGEHRSPSGSGTIAFVAPALASGTYEVVLQVRIGSRNRASTEHAHRFTFSVP